jgi:hypothetical protein
MWIWPLSVGIVASSSVISPLPFGGRVLCDHLFDLAQRASSAWLRTAGEHRRFDGEVDAKQLAGGFESPE